MYNPRLRQTSAKVTQRSDDKFHQTLTQKAACQNRSFHCTAQSHFHSALCKAPCSLLPRSAGSVKAQGEVEARNFSVHTTGKKSKLSEVFSLLSGVSGSLYMIATLKKYASPAVIAMKLI